MITTLIVLHTLFVSNYPVQSGFKERNELLSYLEGRSPGANCQSNALDKLYFKLVTVDEKVAATLIQRRCTTTKITRDLIAHHGDVLAAVAHKHAVAQFKIDFPRYVRDITQKKVHDYMVNEIAGRGGNPSSVSPFILENIAATQNSQYQLMWYETSFKGTCPWG